DPGAALARRNPIEVGEVAEVVERGEAVVEAAVAPEDVADATADVPCLAADVEAEHPSRARGRQQQRRQDLDHRRLAGSVRPEQAEQLAALDGRSEERRVGKGCRWRRCPGGWKVR